MSQSNSFSKNAVSGECKFEVFDKQAKELRPCGKPAKILVGSNDGDNELVFCEEHYVDAIMQLTEHDPSFTINTETENKLRRPGCLK